MKAPDTEELIKEDVQFTDLMLLLIEHRQTLYFSELLVVLMLISPSH